MAGQLQAFVRGMDGNLWLETGPWGNIPQMIARRLQVDGNVSNVFSQVGGNRIWRPAFQPLNVNELFVCGSDGNLWYEPAPYGDVSTVIRNRLQVDGNVTQFWALVETGPWGNVANTIANRRQVDGNVLQFWAVENGIVFVNGNDLNLWLEAAWPWGDVDRTIALRAQVDANVNDLQPIDQNTIFVMGHDGNLWLESAPFGDVAQTVATRQLVDSNVLGFEVLPTMEAYVIDGSQNLWFEFPPYGPANRLPVDATVNACYPVFSEQF
jgi:hypothetical protein